MKKVHFGIGLILVVVAAIVATVIITPILPARNAKAQSLPWECGTTYNTCQIGTPQTIAGNSSQWYCGGGSNVVTEITCGSASGSKTGAAPSCSYSCCSNSNCTGAGQICFNPGEASAYCGVPASCGGSTVCPIGFACTSGQCLETSPVCGANGDICCASSTCNYGLSCQSGMCKVSSATGGSTSVGASTGGNTTGNSGTGSAGAGSSASGGSSTGAAPVCAGGCATGSYCARGNVCLPNACSGGGASPTWSSTGLSAASSSPCQGPINSMASANACNGQAEAQGAALGYSVNCSVIVTTGNPLTGTTYNPVCTVNGVPNQEAYSLAGETGAAYAVNPSWCSEAATASSTAAEIQCGQGNAVYTSSGWVCEQGAEFGGSCSPATGCGGGLSCVNGQCVVGTGTGSTGGTGTSGTGASTGFNINAQNPLNAALSSGWQGFSQVLSGFGGSTGSGATTGGSQSTVSGTTTTGGGSCSSAATATIESSLQTLQGLSAVLTSGNVSPGIMTSIQNLISAVTQVISALAQCV